MRTSIKAIQAFEAAARLGSFALAADELAVTPSAISHQVRLLDEQIGVQKYGFDRDFTKRDGRAF